MSIENFFSNPKRLKLDDDMGEINVKTLYINNSNHNCEELIDSPMNSCEQVSISSAFDQDSSSILSGSLCESNCEIYSSEIIQKGILKSTNHQKETQRQKYRIRFQDVEIFYFNRQQSFCSVPSIGGSALGMEMQHFLSEKFDLKNNSNNNKGDLLKSPTKSNPDSYDILHKDGSYTNEGYSILQPIVAKHRRILLKNSGISRIETVDKEICDLIRSSRERCGCQCIAGQCVPETCSCSQNGIQCQVDRGNFPCGCGPNPCSNPLGRVEFNPIRVRTHFIHTIMRLQMQDQYQSDDSQDNCYSNQRLKTIENNKSDPLNSKEFDITLCNSTNQGSCRDCQNDKYLQVLMNEWTNQLQKLNPVRQYPSNTSLPYESWSYSPEMFCSSIYYSKDFSTVSFLPYSNYTINSLSGLNVGTQHINNYHHNQPQIQYRQNPSVYHTECVEQSMLNFNTKSKHSDFSLNNDTNRLLDYTKHNSVDGSSPKHCHISSGQPLMIHENPDTQVQSSSYMSRNGNFHSFSMAKCEPVEHFPYQSRNPKMITSTKDVCKYDVGFVDNLNASTSKLLCYNTSDFVNTIHYSLSKSNESSNVNGNCDESIISNVTPNISWSDDEETVGGDDDHRNPRIATASNGQLYTVLQPVSQSRIVSTFYQNSQAIDSCKICKFKSPDTRQRVNNFSVSDFSISTDIYHQTPPIKCTEKSEVCA